MATRDQIRSFLLALGLHVALIALIWLSAYWTYAGHEPAAAGEPIRATLQVSSADLRRAQAAIRASQKVPQPASANAVTPQPVPEPRPQMSDVTLQARPQAPQDHPDTVDQERILKSAQLQAEQRVLQEQEERHRQEQVDLTQDIERQQLAEREQRLREYQDVQHAREQAARRTRMEEQRLQQLADVPAARPPPTALPTGNPGADSELLARYKTAMLQTADQNWNHLGAPALSRCRVRFTQIPGGEVINVDFIDCPYDVQGRDFVDRALRKTPMPYSGFDAVFLRQVELTFCYPRADCEP